MSPASGLPASSGSPGSSTPFSITGHIQQVYSHVKIENLVAGLSGGVVSTLVLHPLDLVKIRFAGNLCQCGSKTLSYKVFICPE